MLVVESLEVASRNILDLENYLLDGFRIEGIVLDELNDVVLADLFRNGFVLFGLTGLLLTEELHRPVLVVFYLYF